MEDKLLKRLFIVYFFTFMAAPVSYLIRILFARNLSIEEYGVFYAVIAFFGLIGIFNDFGIKQALVHYLPKFLRNKQYGKIKSSIFIVLGIGIITAVIIAIITYIIKSCLAESFFKTNLTLLILPIFAFIFILQNIFDVLLNIFKGYRKEIFYSSMNPIRLLIVLIISFMIYLFTKENLLILFSITWVLSFLLTIILYLLPLFKTSSNLKKQKSKYDKDIISKLFKYGFFIMLSSAASVLLGRIDVLMLTYFKGVSEVAFYEIALPIASIILIMISPVTSFLFPNISYFYHSKKFDRIKSIIKAIYNTGLFLFLPIGLTFFLFPQEIIIILFGVKYVSAKITLQILSIGFIFKGFSLLNFSIVDGMGKVKIKSLIIYIGAGLNIILNAILIPLAGIEGAAMATSISFFLMFLSSLIFLTKNIKFKPSIKNWIKTIINSILFIIIVYILKTIIEANIYIEATLVLLISGLIYLFIGFKWKILDYNYLKETFLKTIKLR